MSVTVLIFLILILVAMSLCLFKYAPVLFKKKKTARKTVSFTDICYELICGKKNSAKEKLHNIVTASNADALSYIMLCALYRQNGEPQKSIQICEGLILRKFANADNISAILCELARCYRIAGKSGKFDEICAMLKELNLYTAEALLLEADHLARKQEYEQAIKKYQKYEQEAGDATCNVEIAYTYYKMALNEKNAANRQKLLLNSLSFNNADFDTHKALIEHYYAERKTDEGNKALEALANNNFTVNKDQIKELEELFFTYSQIDKLYEIKSKLITAGQISVEPYLVLSSFYMKKHEDEKAIDLLKDYLLTNRQSVMLLKLYARLANDIVLLRAINKEIYTCRQCAEEEAEYTHICPSCGAMSTLEYTEYYGS